ncbi:nucleoside-diphosphate sugar epimerase/dehydratase, partial [Pedobacter antarcticus]
MKSYSGIIRYTSAQDSFRIVYSILFSNSLYFVVNMIFVATGSHALIPTTVLVVNALTCFGLLITYRILIKYFFMYIKNMKLDKVKVMIYGAGEAGILTKRTFDHDPKVNKRIVAFVDDDTRKVGKTIEGIIILDAKNLEQIIAKHELEEIIFATYSIPADVQ